MSVGRFFEPQINLRNGEQRERKTLTPTDRGAVALELSSYPGAVHSKHLCPVEDFRRNPWYRNRPAKPKTHSLFSYAERLVQRDFGGGRNAMLFN